ncbi:PilZ domain-containing protein [Cyanothece sp. BG0011]|uniref:PilZ domain-containing protein n=1 Tax=Cyanothece sp. BG0011 TaxID=2082950 RepID=UPI000D1DECE1|nr:PilZ domain-containing protein [Cyanothece sp. BG0011]
MSYSLPTQKNSNQTLFSVCNQRKHQRYDNSQGSSIELLIDGQEIKQSLKGMIIDDSFSGCGLIIIGEEGLYVGQLCSLKIKKIETILCQIIWLKKLDKCITRVGIKYLIKSD